MYLIALFGQFAQSIDVAPVALALFLSPVMVCPLITWACDRRGCRR